MKAGGKLPAQKRAIRPSSEDAGGAGRYKEASMGLY